MSLVHRLSILALLLSGQVAAQNSPGAPLQPKDLEAIWQDFILHDDAGTRKAQQGIAALVRSPVTAVAFLQERLKPLPPADAKLIERCLADLDSNSFSTREQATKELEKQGALAGPALERKLKEKALSLEARQRIEMLVEKLKKTTLAAEELRAIRAIEVLEGIGNAAAVAVLEGLARGGEGALVTDQSRQALARLARRGK